MSRGSGFDRFAVRASEAAGSPLAFVVALALVAAWLVEGVAGTLITGSPAFLLDGNYQLQINTLTTVLTFLLIFLVQYTQNKDSRAQNLKQDVLIAASGARNDFAAIEDLDDKQLRALRERVEARIAKADPDGDGRVEP
jgi:low affinity Fe/Cu permease